MAEGFTYAVAVSAYQASSGIIKVVSFVFPAMANSDEAAGRARRRLDEEAPPDRGWSAHHITKPTRICRAEHFIGDDA